MDSQKTISIKIGKLNGFLYRDKKSPNWYFSCIKKGKRIRKSLHTEDSEIAKERFREEMLGSKKHKPATKFLQVHLGDGRLGGLYKDARSDSWYLSAHRKGVRIRKSLRTNSMEEAIAISKTINPTCFDNQEELDIWRSKGGLNKLLRSAKERARKKCLAFSISLMDVEEMYERANGKCEVSLLNFQTKSMMGIKRRPFVPSIDRKDNSIGYTKDNCRIVCCAVNIAMNEFGEDVFLEIANAILFNGKGRN